MSERTISEEQVRAEHLKEVYPPAQWAYVLGVLAVGTLLMLGLIALMGSGS